ncbi:MAG: hypothetical protein WCO56_12085 [Verrucomicrobiota bacterium]
MPDVPPDHGSAETDDRSSQDSGQLQPVGATHQNGASSTGPGRLRGIAVLVAVILVIWLLDRRVQTGADEWVTKLGKIEVTARLLERPDQFPKLGAYRYTYVLKYRVLQVIRPDSQGKYPLKPGDDVFVGHYKPWLPRSQIKDGDWGDSPLGGKLDGFVVGEVHRMALDYALQDLAPSGTLDYCFPPGTNRFFALWANPTTY